MPYPTVADMHTYLRANSQQPLPPGDDTLLGQLLASAIAAIEGPVGAGRRFQVDAPSTRLFDAVRDVEGRVLWLDEDLCRLDSVVNGDGTPIPLNMLAVEPTNARPIYALRLKANSALLWTYTDTPEQSIQVTGLWGYSQAAPHDIAQAALRLATFFYRQKDSSADIDRPLLSGDGVTIMPTSLPSDVMAICKHYRRIV